MVFIIIYFMNYFWKTIIATVSCVLISTSIWTFGFAQTESMTNQAETELITTPKRTLPIVSQETQDKVRSSTDIAMYGVETESLSWADNQNNQEEDKNKIFEYNIPNINSQKVQESRLSWVNYERSTRWLDPLTIDYTLTATSSERAEYLADNNKFKRMHQRPWQSCENYWCYDTDSINQRALKLDIPGAEWNLIQWESTMFGWYSCKSDDCTDKFISSTKWKSGGPSGFLGFLMWEKKRNGVHYKMMMSKEYTKVWFWFALTRSSFWGTYIGVIHFGG